MNIGGYEFRSLGIIEPAREPDGSVKIFMPQDRYANAKNLPLNNYGAGPFCRFRLAKGEPFTGVYALCQKDEILYIGQTVNMDKRWSSNGYGGISPRNCFKGGQETNCRINHLIYQKLIADENLELWFHKTANEKDILDHIERGLIAALTPIWNKARVA